jgi:hypothetical protein
MDILALLAKWSPRLEAALKLPNEVEDVFVAVEDIIHDLPGTKVQRLKNEIGDVRRTIHRVLGR